MEQSDEERKIDLDLSNVNGNAFAIMGAFSQQARREGWSRDEISKVFDEAKKGDYDHLLTEIMRHIK